ncbi:MULTISPECIES: photosynthetic complex putative assembly protein PuhB [Methylobacterium]|uniref:Phosphopantetheine adenylyltransferase n=3 Tax=Methylobacterium TaxID=407 RepID=A0A0C6FFP2_9HYPH|nr:MULTISPECIES: photosynthetic complex putative assembly protein PuhB [Methylobacterium]MBZ6414252.1 PH domain-containing protein [Methylobacterium sp.]BAQ43839.1 phosphopantetheine adenylyltransferase [Methylobacterium aquaticum]SFE46936.1 PH domain-containing protein [Methylobacterium sp. yr596]
MTDLLPHGLPGPLPKGERLLWQGRPALVSLARRAFHVDLVALYFGGLAGFQAYSSGRVSAAWPVLLAGALALVILFALAWGTCRTTVYTLTDRRLMLRIGIALQMDVNLPLKEIEGAAFHRFGDASGDLPLRLKPGVRLAYLHLWPHARPWRLTRPEPMLRCVPEAEAVAKRIATALAEASGQPVQALPPAPAASPVLPGRLAAAGH